MDKIGLKSNFPSGFFLSAAIESSVSAERRSIDRKNYGKMLKQFSTQLNAAIKDKNIEALLALEKDALEYNFHKFTHARDKELCRDALSSLKLIKKEWTQGQDKKAVIADIEDAHSGIDKPTKPIKNTAMRTAVNSLLRKIRTIAGRDLTPAEELFYTKRREGLKLVNAEHHALVNQYLGFGASKEESREG